MPVAERALRSTGAAAGPVEIEARAASMGASIAERAGRAGFEPHTVRDPRRSEIMTRFGNDTSALSRVVSDHTRRAITTISSAGEGTRTCEARDQDTITQAYRLGSRSRFPKM